MRGIALISLAAALSGCASYTDMSAYTTIKKVSFQSTSVTLSDPANPVNLHKVYVQTTTLDGFESLANALAIQLSNDSDAITDGLVNASAGNYIWGLSLAAASLANIHVSALKGIAFGGGAHVALSTKLSPLQQQTIINDAANRVQCLQDVSASLNSKHQAASTAQANYLAEAKQWPDGIKKLDLPAKQTEDVGKLKSGLTKIVIQAQTRLQGVINNSSPATIASDFIQKNRDAIASLRQAEQTNANSAASNNSIATLDKSSKKDTLTQLLKAKDDAEAALTTNEAALPVSIAACTN